MLLFGGKSRKIRLDQAIERARLVTSDPRKRR